MLRGDGRQAAHGGNVQVRSVRALCEPSGGEAVKRGVECAITLGTRCKSTTCGDDDIGRLGHR
jgi:hypothetical protein